MKSKQDKGFTLVEVMVALVVVAIVSTPLLQMFVTTSYTNKDAQVMDSLNVIAVQKAETFKADPATVYNLEHHDPEHPDYYYYYKGDLTPIYPSSDQDFNDPKVIPDGAVFMIKSHLPYQAPTLSNDAGYYPDFAGSIDLAKYTTDLVVNINNTYDIEVKPVVDPPFVSDRSKITNKVIPIRVDFVGDSRTIKVTNDSDLEVEFYIFNTQNGVTLTTLRGASSIAYVSNTGTGSDKEYNLTLTVKKLSKGVWVEMFTYSANKHIYN